MILTDSYICQDRDALSTILCGFSAIDERIIAQMAEEEVAQNGARILVRLGALMLVHGPGAVRDFVQLLGCKSGTDLFQSISQLLDLGHISQIDKPHRELQQEVLHFSRICDLQFVSRKGTEKRLSRSTRLPNSLKFLVELAILLRSRIMTQSPDALRSYTPPEKVDQQHCAEISCCTPEHGESFGLFVSSSRFRSRKQFCYLFEQLLSYLPPYDAFICLVAFLCESGSTEIEAILLDSTHGRVPGLHWKAPTKRAVGDVIRWALAALPQPINLSASPQSYRLGRQALVLKQKCDYLELSGIDGAVRHVRRYPSPSNAELKFAYRQHIVPALAKLRIASLECGHVHLDRDLDVDQEIGIKLGREYLDYLVENNLTQRPFLCPMVDDDHVLVRLRPSDYSVIFSDLIQSNEFTLLPESSPIIRAIVAALYRRIVPSMPHLLFERGGNLYLETRSGLVCELFEDLNGHCSTGCVLFEVALLIYRTHPRSFDVSFSGYFELDYNVHERILHILSTDQSHDTKIRLLRTLYGEFRELTDPRLGPTWVDRMLDIFCSGNPSHKSVHVNILESYYESQQDKVRQLLLTLSLPIRLISVLFSTNRVWISR